MIEVSVIILTYQDLNEFFKTLKSLESLRQKFEIIVIDCNPTQEDSITNYIKSSNAPKIRSYHLPESKISVAMNFGLSKSTSEYVWFLNSGDTVKTFIEENFYLDSFRATNLIVGSAEIINSHGFGYSWKFPNPTSWNFYFGFNSICHQACIFKREKVIEIGGVPMDNHFDWLLIVRYIKSFGFVQVNSFKVLYLSGGTSSRENLFMWAVHKIRLRKKYREEFGGYFVSDVLIYSLYLCYRLLANFLVRKRFGKWWTVAN